MDLVARAVRVERRIKGLLDEKNGLVKELSKVEAELAGLQAYLGRLTGGYSDEHQEAYMDAMYGPLETGDERPPRPSRATVRVFPSGDEPQAKRARVGAPAAEPCVLEPPATEAPKTKSKKKRERRIPPTDDDEAPVKWARIPVGKKCPMLTCSNRHHGKHLSAGRWSNPTELKVEVGTQLEARDIFMFQSQLLKEDQHPSWKNTRGFVVKRAGANWKLCAPPRHGGWTVLQIAAKVNGNKPTPPLDVEWQTTRHTHQICGPYTHPGPCILTEVHSRGIDASTWDWCALAPGHYGQRRCPDCRWKQARE